MSFIGLRELEEIDLSGNYISHIEPESFAGMPHLTRINLVRNDLSTLESWYFRAVSFEHATLSLDGNPFYCDEDLKENIDLIKDKVTVGGLICAGGEIWRILGKVRGRTYEDVESQIRKNFESWEIALLTISSFILLVIILGVIFVVYRVKTSDYTTGEIIRGTNRRDSNIRKSYQGDEDDRQNGIHSRPQSAPGNRKIEIRSEDHYYDEDDDAMFGGNPQPPYSDSGSERPQSPPDRRS